jgi:site-specific recombinase XerD
VVSEIGPGWDGPGREDEPRRDVPDSVPAVRQMMKSEFCAWLRTRTNRHGRPFQEDTVSAYRDAVVALDKWLTKTGLDCDFTGCDTAVLNRFFAEYLAANCQNGTNTKQRNLRHFFTWLEQAYGHPHPYTDGLNRYSPAKTRPSTLGQQFVSDLLGVTGGGHARGFRRRA